MLKIGCHLSNAKGYVNMMNQALDIGANTFQFFTRNPRGSRVKNIDHEDIGNFNNMMKENNFNKIVGHAPYTLNPASPDNRVLNYAYLTVEEDLSLMELMPGNFYNMHPGSHVKSGVEEGIKRVIDVLNQNMSNTMTTTILLETMSGKGSEIGRTFEELLMIIDGLNHPDKVGICLDTCHVYDGGYDIKEDLDGVLYELDKVIGIERLHAIHINDTKNPFASHKDRHEKIGDGYLGEEFFFKLINHKDLKDKIFILETPNEIEGYAAEIKLLKYNYGNIDF